MNTEQLYPLISVIVPVYKVEQYLENCIESVIGQSYENWELILVDDGSPDNCPQICDNYAAKDSRIRVIHKANGGLSSARNAGLDMCQGDYITFLDSDDFLHEEFLYRMIKLCLDNNAQISQCRFIRGQESTFPEMYMKGESRCYTNHTIFTMQQATILVCCKLYAKDVWQGIRMPVGYLHEDDWTTWKLYYRCQTIAITNDQLYYYTRNPNGIMGTSHKKIDITYLGAYEERIKFFISSGEIDLEHCSRIQLCKSIVLSLQNPSISDNEYKQLLDTFYTNWRILKKSSFLHWEYRIIFTCFAIAPQLSSKFARKYRRVWRKLNGR